MGGETQLMKECGAASISGESSIFSESVKKSLIVSKTLSELGKDLKVFEAEIVNSALERTR